MNDEKSMPTLGDLCQALEQTGKTDMSEMVRQAAAASRLMNPFLEVDPPHEMADKLKVFRKAEVSQRYVTINNFQR